MMLSKRKKTLIFHLKTSHINSHIISKHFLSSNYTSKHLLIIISYRILWWYASSIHVLFWNVLYNPAEGLINVIFFCGFIKDGLYKEKLILVNALTKCIRKSLSLSYIRLFVIQFFSLVDTKRIFWV